MKFIATDYDGTLKYKKDVTQEDLDAIKKWKSLGNLFVIDTGRSMESILIEAKKYNIPVDYFITNNGGMVFDGNGNEMFASYLGNEISIDIMYIAKEVGGVVSYVVNDGFYRHRIVVNEDYVEKRYPGLHPDMSEEELMKLGKYAQIVISMENPQRALELAKQINDHFSDTIVAYANKYVVDVVPKGVSKATGLQFLCDYLDCHEKDVYTLGDADNDIPLMEYCSNGGCMSLASKEVQKHAKVIYENMSDMIENIVK